MFKCISCGKELKNPLITLKNAPANAQHMPGKDELIKDSGIDLPLYKCCGCGLCQLGTEPVFYYKDVIRAGGGSSTMKNLRRSQYSRLIETCGLAGKRILEAGCGKGEFLNVLCEFPVKAYGIEHDEELVKAARANGLNVWKDFADHPVKAPGEEEPFDAFLSFNFLEHQPDPVKMLKALFDSIKPSGYGLITVPALSYIVERGTYYELIRDHIAYYSKGSLRKLLTGCGFIVLYEETVNRDTLSVTVQRPLPGGAPAASAQGIPAEEAPDEDRALIEKSLNEGRRVTEGSVEALIKECGKIAVWGASHQGFTLISTTALKDAVPFIVDSAPFKQGKYAPASHIPIVSPEEFFSSPCSAVLIAAPGYTEEIAGIIRQKAGDGIRIFTIRTREIEEL